MEIDKKELEKIAGEIIAEINNIISDRVTKILFGEDIVSVEPSENEWNAWVTDKFGLKSFVSGGYLDYMKLKVNLAFSVRSKMTEYLINEQDKLGRIELEWYTKVGYNK